jgi:hypothetical protein
LAFYVGGGGCIEAVVMPQEKKRGARDISDIKGKGEEKKKYSEIE